MDPDDSIFILSYFHGIDGLLTHEKKRTFHHDAGIPVSGGSFSQRNVVAGNFPPSAIVSDSAYIPFDINDSGISAHPDDGRNAFGCAFGVDCYDSSNDHLWFNSHAELQDIST